MKNIGRDHQAILEKLRDKGARGATTTEMVEAGFNGYRGRITELRQEGYAIRCEYDGMTDEGRKRHRYYLDKEPDASIEVNLPPFEKVQSAVILNHRLHVKPVFGCYFCVSGTK